MGTNKPVSTSREKRPLGPRERVFAAVAVVLGVVGAFAIAEVFLRAIDFNPGRVNSGYLQFGYETGIPQFDEDGLRVEGDKVQVELFQPDRELLWTPIPGTSFTNSRGLRGKREYSEAKPAGTIRILFVGDSCTFLGDPVYPQIVEHALSAKFPGKKFECVNASVPGYSSFQGSRLIEKLRGWQPDFVSVYFGWNDHWPAQGGLTDREQLALGHGMRLAAIFDAWRARARRAPVNRVPLPEFEANLEAIRRAVSSWPARVVFVTAPTGFRGGGMPEWSYRFFGDNYHMGREAVDAIPSTHQAYAEAVRRIASRGAILVDAERAFREEALPPEIVFRNDSIHLQTPGHERVGYAVAEAIGKSIEATPIAPK